MTYATPQPVVLPGDYTIAAGATNLQTCLPAASYPRNLAWCTDRTPNPGYMVSTLVGAVWTWVSTAAGIPTASNATPIIEGVGAAGVSADYSRADHVHPAQSAPAFAVGAPVARTLAFATAYQATTNTKPAAVSIVVDCTTTISLGSPQANTVELIIGATNAVASGTGTLADTFRSDLSVSILISLGWTGRQSLQCTLPVGYYFAVRRTAGTGMTIVSAFDQALG